MTVGSVERPVEILTGKRERRKVDRLSANMFTPATPAEKKRTLIPEGSGVKLGDCPASKILVIPWYMPMVSSLLWGIERTTLNHKCI